MFVLAARPDGRRVRHFLDQECAAGLLRIVTGHIERYAPAYSGRAIAVPCNVAMSRREFVTPQESNCAFWINPTLAHQGGRSSRHFHLCANPGCIVISSRLLNVGAEDKSLVWIFAAVNIGNNGALNCIIGPLDVGHHVQLNVASSKCRSQFFARSIRQRDCPGMMRADIIAYAAKLDGMPIALRLQVARHLVQQHADGATRDDGILHEA